MAVINEGDNEYQYVLWKNGVRNTRSYACITPDIYLQLKFSMLDISYHIVCICIINIFSHLSSISSLYPQNNISE